MKKLIGPVILLCFFITLSISCKKDEKTGQPYIVVNPPVILNWSKDLPYVDPGATAYNVSDSGDTTNITDRVQTTDNVDVSTLGKYTVWYNVSNESGAEAEQKTREVNVVIAK